MQLFDKKELTARTVCASSHARTVRFSEVDAAGIVYFSRFFEFAHEAYEQFLSAAGVPLSEVLESQSWAAPLRHAEADYFAPLRLGEKFEVRLVAASVEESEITLGWSVWSEQRAVAVIQTAHTFVDPRTFQKVPVPKALVEALSAVSGSETPS